jgi:hypothetical protein
MPLCSVKSSYCQRLGVSVLYTERLTSSSGLPNRYYQVFFPQSTFPWRRLSEALCHEKGLSQSCQRYACDASTPQAATQSISVPPELCDLWGWRHIRDAIAASALCLRPVIVTAPPVLWEIDVGLILMSTRRRSHLFLFHGKIWLW